MESYLSDLTMARCPLQAPLRVCAQWGGAPVGGSTQRAPKKSLKLPSLAPSTFPAPPAVSTLGPWALLSQR